jgi:hypothetical protein
MVSRFPWSNLFLFINYNCSSGKTNTIQQTLSSAADRTAGPAQPDQPQPSTLTYSPSVAVSSSLTAWTAPRLTESTRTFFKKLYPAQFLGSIRFDCSTLFISNFLVSWPIPRTVLRTSRTGNPTSSCSTLSTLDKARKPVNRLNGFVYWSSSFYATCDLPLMRHPYWV